MSYDQLSLVSEQRINRQATYEQYVGMPSLLSPLEIGALPLARCMQKAGQITVEQQTGSASCAFELAQVYTMTDRPEQALVATAFAKHIAKTGRNVLETRNRQRGAACYDPYYLDTLYRLDAFIAQIPYAVDERFWNATGKRAVPNAQVFNGMQELFRPLGDDRSRVKQKRPDEYLPPQQRQQWRLDTLIQSEIDSLDQLEAEMALVQLSNRALNRGRCVGMLASARERHPSDGSDDAFDIKYIFPDGTWIPARVLRTKLPSQAPHPNIAEIDFKKLDPDTKGLQAADIVAMLNGTSDMERRRIKNRADLLLNAANVIYEHITKTPRMPLKGVLDLSPPR